MIYTLIFLQASQGFISFLNVSLLFVSNLYIPSWLEKNFKFMVFRLLENALAIQKEFENTYSCPTRQNLPQVIITPWTEGNY